VGIRKNSSRFSEGEEGEKGEKGGKGKMYFLATLTLLTHAVDYYAKKGKRREEREGKTRDVWFQHS